MTTIPKEMATGNRQPHRIPRSDLSSSINLIQSLGILLNLGFLESLPKPSQKNIVWVSMNNPVNVIEVGGIPTHLENMTSSQLE